MSPEHAIDVAGCRLELDEGTLCLSVRIEQEVWRTAAGDEEVTVARGGETTSMPLAAAGVKKVEPYESGTSKGFRVDLAGLGGSDVKLVLVVAMDLGRPELTIRLMAAEGQSAVRRLSWPGPIQAPHPDGQTTVLPLKQGLLLPGDWPHAFEYRHILNGGGGMYMPWWGHCRVDGAVLAIVDTPADAGVAIVHPAGGPTAVGVDWLASLGRLAYPRVMKMLFLPAGDFVALAKAYRRHVQAQGRFVALTEKLARTPALAGLIGAPVIHTDILRHVEPASRYYRPDDPAANHRLVDFATRARQLRQLKQRGVERAYVHLDGWGRRGYDNLHPDVLPPCEEAGGWDGLRGLLDTCHELGYFLALHDQYRDYYMDAPSFDPRHAIRDEQGQMPEWAIWLGGRQSVLCASLAYDYLRRNLALLERNGTRPDGMYLDVFASVDADECFYREHPMTRTECMEHRARCFGLVRSRGGIISSEEPMDFALDRIDLVHWGPYATLPELHGRGPAVGVPVPLLNLVYHDSVVVPWMTGNDPSSWGPSDDDSAAHAALNGAMPYLPIDADDARLELCQRLCRLHEKVALKELIAHELLDAGGRRRRSVFADGTAVTADLDSGRFDWR